MRCEQGGNLRGVPSRVAPLFNHGKGIAEAGGIGDVGVMMGEMDARRIIEDEAKKGGIIFSASPGGMVRDVPLGGISLTPRTLRVLCRR